MQQFRHDFAGGLNSDGAAETLQANEYINGQNMRFGLKQYGDFGRMEAIESNRRIINNVAPAGTNLPIGRCVDTVRDRCFGMFWNSAGNHFIAVMQQDETVLLVLQNNQVTGGLGFDQYKPIHSIEVLGDLMYWTEDSEPRKLNVEAAIKANNAGYVTTVAPYILPVAYTVTTLSRKPVNYPPAAVKVTDTTILVNQLQTEGFRFAYYYQYRDGEVSTLSIQSLLVPGNFVAQTENAIDISLPFSERIEQDVQVVVLVAIFATDEKRVEIKKWDKSSGTSAAEIASHNAGTTNLTYRFANTSFGESVDDAFSVKLFDFVWPSNTLALADDRLHIGFIREGYNTPKRSSLQFTLRNQLAASGNVLLKSRSRYAGIIVFFDDFEKAITGPEGYAVLDMGEPGFIGGTDLYNRAGDWSVSNLNALVEIPVEAKFYSICMTKNLVAQFFLQAFSPSVLYADTDASTGKYTFTSTTYSPARTGIGVRATYLIGYGLGYTFNKGDIAKLKLDNPANPTMYTLAVKDTQGDWIILEPQQIGTLIASSGAAFEIYTPTASSEYNNYYEVGLRYPITNPGTNIRTYSTLSGTLPGDVFMVLRNTATTAGYFEAMNFNEKVWREWNTSHGRLYTVQSTGQQILKTGQRWSNKYLPGTTVNGLSSFDAADLKILPATMGSVKKLVLTNKIQEEGKVMLAIGEDETISEYLSEVQVQSTEGSAYVAQSLGVIGTINPLRGSYGTQHPESVTTSTDGIVAWLDISRDTPVAYSTGGLQPLNKGATRFWQDWCREYRRLFTTATRSPIVSGIDVNSKELLFALPTLGATIAGYWNVYDRLAKVMVYNYANNQWNPWRNEPQQQYFMLNNRQYAMKDKDFFAHDVNDTKVVLNGTQYPCRIMFIYTENNYDATKVLNNISVIAKEAPDYSFAESFQAYPQQTDLIKTDYSNKQGKFYADWLNNTIHDILTPQDALIFGEKMSSEAIYIMLQWNGVQGTASRQNRLFVNSVYIGAFMSIGHTV